MSFFIARSISISFGVLKALKDISSEVETGEVFCIIGPNGAGKTTIFNCISRLYNLDSGEFILKEKNISKVRPHAVVDMGVARTFQNIELFKNMSVLDNLLLGRHRRRCSNVLSEILFTNSVRIQEIEGREKVEDIIDFLDLQVYRDQLVGNLPYGARKTVELGRALAMEPELLLLDEPSSGMTVEDTQDLAFWIEDIKKDLGITILVVEHNMGLVKDISDRVLAMNFGEVIIQGRPDDVRKHPEVMKAYLGEEDAVT